MIIELFSTSRPVQLVQAGDGPTLIVNRDIVNSVLYGDRSITSQNFNSYSVIDALGSVTVDGTTDVYAIPLAGTPTVDVVNGAGEWAPSPALVALQISTLGLAKDTSVATVNNTLGTPAQNAGLTTINGTLGTPAQRADVQGLTIGGNPGGIPILRGTDNFGFASAQTIAASVNATLVNGTTLTKPGFEAVFQLNLPAAAGTVPFAILQLFWQDSNTGLQVGLKQYVLTCGNGPSNVLTFYLSGPCRGNQIVLKLRNMDPAQTMTVTWAFNQTSHTYLSDRLLQATYAATAPIGQVNPNGNPSKGLLFSSSPSIGPSGTVLRLCAASNAKCKLAIDNGAQANGCAVILESPSTTTLYDEPVVQTSFSALVAAAGLRSNQEIQMPNGPVQVRMVNQAATNTIVPNVTIIAMEY